MQAQHVPVKDLPLSIRRALSALGYHASRDIAIEPATDFCPSASGSGSGRRAFCVAVDLATGTSQAYRGSWGGPNMFNPRNAVDLDGHSYPIAPGFVVIQGSEGYPKTYATLLVHPDTLRPLLPAAPQAPLSPREQLALEVLAGIKSGYRQEELDRRTVYAYPDTARQPRILYSATAPEYAALISRGYATANRSGALQITTAGKNARQGLRP